jgi:hypothetical protein
VIPRSRWRSSVRRVSRRAARAAVMGACVRACAHAWAARALTLSPPLCAWHRDGMRASHFRAASRAVTTPHARPHANVARARCGCCCENELVTSRHTLPMHATLHSRHVAWPVSLWRRPVASARCAGAACRLSRRGEAAGAALRAAFWRPAAPSRSQTGRSVQRPYGSPFDEIACGRDDDRLLTTACAPGRGGDDARRQAPGARRGAGTARARAASHRPWFVACRHKNALRGALPCLSVSPRDAGRRNLAARARPRARARRRRRAPHGEDRRRAHAAARGGAVHASAGGATHACSFSAPPPGRARLVLRTATALAAPRRFAPRTLRAAS